LQNKGPGLHHICLGVDDIEERLVKLKSRGARLINEIPTLGAGGASIAFIHPKASGGVLIELSQPEDK
jgi:methylmalonyl-CoA epimerase